MYIVQIGLYLCLISKRCCAGFTKDIEQTKILGDGLGLTHRELTQGERDLAMFPEVSSRHSYSDHVDTARSNGESPDLSSKTLAKGYVLTGSQARFPSATNSDRSSEDVYVSSMEKDQQRAYPVAQYERFPGYGNAAHQPFRDQLSHYHDNVGFDQHAPPAFPITDQYQTNLYHLPAPDVMIPAFSNPAAAASHSPLGQAMAVMPTSLTPEFAPNHMQTDPTLYHTPFPYEPHLGYNTQPSHFFPTIDPMSNLQNFWPQHIPAPQSFTPPQVARHHDANNLYIKPSLSKVRDQNPPRTNLNGIRNPEKGAVPDISSKTKTKESKQTKPTRKEVHQTKPSSSRPETKTISGESELGALKSTEENLPTASSGLESDLNPEGKSKILVDSEESSTSPSAETVRTASQPLENGDKHIAELKRTPMRLWTDIASQPGQEQKAAQSSLIKERHSHPQGKGRPFGKDDIKSKKSISQLRSEVNSKLEAELVIKTDASDSHSDLNPTKQNPEWIEYQHKKGRKGKFLTQKPTRQGVVHNEVDGHNSFVLPDEESVSKHPQYHMPNSIHDVSVEEAHPKQDAVAAVSDPHPQDAAEFTSNSISKKPNPDPNELINSVSEASKSFISDKTQKPRTKPKGKARKPKKKSQIGGSRFEDDPDASPTPNGLKSDSSETKNDVEQMNEILSKVLQKNNQKDRVKIDLDDESYKTLLSLRPPSETTWIDYRTNFHTEFGNPTEARRRWNALAAQIDQRIATKNWKDLIDVTAEPVKKLALRLKINEEWPTFDKVDLAYGEETMRMLEDLNSDHLSALTGLFGDKPFRVRLATIYLTSRRSHSAKRFDNKQLVDFMKQGGVVPILYEVHDCLEMQLAEVNWDKISKEVMKSKLNRLLKAMSGRISNGATNLELTRQSWPSTWTREYLSRLSGSSNSAPFQPRLHSFYRAVEKMLDPQSVLSWRGVSNLEGIEKSAPVWSEELLTAGQVLAGANFDLSPTVIGMMIHLSKQNLNVLARHKTLEENIVWWPTNAPLELMHKFYQFKDFYQFCGYKLKIPIELIA